MAPRSLPPFPLRPFLVAPPEVGGALGTSFCLSPSGGQTPSQHGKGLELIGLELHFVKLSTPLKIDGKPPGIQL